MIHTQASYKHQLVEGLYLTAFAIDPNLKQKDLELLLTSKEGTAQISSDIDKNIIPAGSVKDIDNLKVEIDLEKKYHVPAQLQAYRDAVGRASDAKGRYNGPVAIVDGPLEIPLRFFQGGYYDFIATKLKAVPADLVPEQYPLGKTIEQLFTEWGINQEERARYFGFAHLLLAGDGKELCFVQRAKGMAIAPDCISVSGSTPNPQFEPNFNFQQYCQEHLLAEMKEEFNMDSSDFRTGGLHLFDDKPEVPFAAIEINTLLPAKELAKRIYGQPQAIKEHPVVYAMPPEGIPYLLEKFPVFPSMIQVFRTLYDTHCSR